MPLAEFLSTHSSKKTTTSSSVVVKRKLLEWKNNPQPRGVRPSASSAATLAPSSLLEEKSVTSILRPKLLSEAPLPANHKARRIEVAKRRESRHEAWVKKLEEVSTFGLPSMSYLETRSVAPDTQRDYREKFLELCSFLENEGIKDKIFGPDEQVDEALTAFIHFRFFAGYQHGDGGKAISAFQFMFPRFQRLGKGALPRTARAMKGWRRLNPKESRTPPPLGVMCALAVLMETFTEFTGVALMTGESGYLRPGELMRLRPQDLIEPQNRGEFAHWAIRLAPLEVGRPTKTLEYDAGVMMDREEHLEFYDKVFRKLKSSREGQVSLWGFKGMDLVKAFAAAQDVMGLHPKYHLYTMRHSGPSHDRAANVRSLLEVQKRGRWKSIQNCWRYEKATMGQLQHQQLSHQQKHFMIFCRRHLTQLLTASDKSRLPRHLEDVDRVRAFFEA